jgi:rare lipoprotein A
MPFNLVAMSVRLIAIKVALFTYLIVFVSACTSSRYSLENDVGPSGSFDASQVPDAVAVWEPLSSRGNHSPYEVRGKTYQLLGVSDDYIEQGVASWYGLKFHGELTSNGEIYNMYAMSAAHKTLPLPAYLKVTNLENNRTIVVRVNDRGPFHGDRIIDLSYAAAKKLGYDKKGTAMVRLELIKPVNKASIGGGKQAYVVDRVSNFIQLGAFSKKQAAEKLLTQLKGLESLPDAFIGESKTSPVIYRVRLGPIDQLSEAKRILGEVTAQKIGQPMLIKRAVSAKGS